MESEPKALKIVATFPLRGECAAPHCTGIVVAVGATDVNPATVAAVSVCRDHVKAAAHPGPVFAFAPTCGRADKPGDPPCGARTTHVGVFRADDEWGVVFLCDRHVEKETE